MEPQTCYGLMSAKNLQISPAKGCFEPGMAMAMQKPALHRDLARIQLVSVVCTPRREICAPTRDVRAS